MSSSPQHEQQALLDALNSQRAHVFEALRGLDADDLRRKVLPSGWTCLGLVNHLALDVERFWFQAVVVGDRSVVEDVLTSSDNAWDVADDEPAEDVLGRYRADIESSDAIITTRSLDAAPAWWPDFFDSSQLQSVREIVFHVVVETATHAGHLDVVRELIDGTQHLVLTE
jgi:uncharacterized damage-inducible protein DinB